MNKISFHPNGKYLISASDDTTIKIWDIRMGSIMFTLYGHDGPATAVTFSSCGDYFATGGEDTLVNVWKSNLDSNGDHDTLEEVKGLIAVGGLKDTTLKSNISTYMVSDNNRKGLTKAKLRTQQSAGSNMGQDYLKSDPSRSDLLS